MTATTARQRPAPTEPAHHVVQCYGADSEQLLTNVAQYLSAGAERGDSLLVIATPAHTDALLRQAEGEGGAIAQAVDDGRFATFDARHTLDAFLLDGQPDPNLFDLVVGGVVRTLRARHPGSSVRAYGEMVALLWKAWQFGAAIRLEECWNRLLTVEGVNLFCAYPIDVFGLEFDPGVLHALLCAHTHLVPTTPHLSAALERAMDEVLGSDAAEHRAQIAADARWGVVPPGEATVLWLRANLPNRAEEIVQQARRYCQTSTAA